MRNCYRITVLVMLRAPAPVTGKIYCKCVSLTTCLFFFFMCVGVGGEGGGMCLSIGPCEVYRKLALLLCRSIQYL